VSVVSNSGGRPPALPAVAEASGTSYGLGPVDQIPYGEGRAFATAGHQIAVFRKRDGSLRALSAVCPHQGGPIADGQIDNTVVLCPLHMNAFELDTGHSTTGITPLRSYRVEIDDGQIFVFVP
jgi:nitrite reductase [NAD(P)H] small subunit